MSNILDELILKQRKEVPKGKKLTYCELKRLSRYLRTSIFDDDKCSMFTGYIHQNGKCRDINFFFRGKKCGLHRLLYINFVDDIDERYYLRCTCKHKYSCCNVNHVRRYEYSNKKQVEEHRKEDLPEEFVDGKIIISFDDEIFI